MKAPVEDAFAANSSSSDHKIGFLLAEDEFSNWCEKAFQFQRKRVLLTARETLAKVREQRIVVRTDQSLESGYTSEHSTVVAKVVVVSKCGETKECGSNFGVFEVKSIKMLTTWTRHAL